MINRCTGRLRTRRAFTLIDVMMTVTIVVFTAILVIPYIGDERRTRLMAASKVLISDLEQAQVMTIARPDEPIIVRFESDGSAYWLARKDEPDTPLMNDLTGEPYRVEFGHGRAGGASGVMAELFDIENDTLAFNAFGGIDTPGDPPRIRLKIDGRAADVRISPSTGTIREVEPDDNE